MKIGDFMRRAIVVRDGRGGQRQEPCKRATCRAARRNQARQFYRRPVFSAQMMRAVCLRSGAIEPAWVGMVLRPLASSAA